MRTIKEYQFLIALALIAGCWALWQLRFVVAVLFGGYIVAAAVLPIVGFITHRNIPRIIAITLIVLVFFSIIALLGYILAAPIASAWQDIGNMLEGGSNGLNALLNRFGVDTTSLANWMNPQNFASATATTASAAAGAFSAFIIGLYLAYDWPRVSSAISSLTRHREKSDQIIQQQVAQLGAWTRGQITLSLVVGVLIYALLMLVGFPFALTLGLIAGIFEFIPYAGPILAAAPAVLIAVPQGLTSVLVVIIIYVVVQQLENHLLVPLIMQRATYIHPIVSIAAILTGFEVMGIAGALLAIPLVSVVWVTYKVVRA